MRRHLMVVFLLLVSSGALFSASVSRSYQVVHGWPQLPEGFAFGQVSGVAVDSHNHVFVFHRGDRPIICFEGGTGKMLHYWGDGMFTNAHGLSVDSHDNVWVTDTRGHQVFKFSHKGELLMRLGEKGVAGVDEKHFNLPTDVVVAPNGEFYVADGYGNSRVVKFSPEGKFLLTWGKKGEGPGEFNLPHGIALDAQGRVYVADRTNSRIQVFDGNGKFLHQWKSEELGRPWALEVGRDGYLYVVDGGDVIRPSRFPYRNRALKLDLKGNIIEKWGSFGSYDGQFYWAHDIAVAANGDVYIGDVDLGMRVQKFMRKP